MKREKTKITLENLDLANRAHHAIYGPAPRETGAKFDRPSPRMARIIDNVLGACHE